MEAQIAQFTNRGMYQDVSVSKATNEFAFKNYNIRIVATNDNTLLSITNEKLPKELDRLEGFYVGHAIANEYLVLFTKNIDNDRIFRIKIENDEVTTTLLFEGDLSFYSDNVESIETLFYYESEDIQKVYWVDGIHQPRVINIKSNNIIEGISTQFDFNPPVNVFPNVTITKEYSGIGLFPSGVIQYFISYYNKFGAETGIIWSSDLQYVTEYNRAAGPDENVVCNFKIDINNIDTTYEYARVYSMQRTSLNTTPICRIVGDININNSNTITITDTNTNTETIDPTQLLFLGGDNFIASTLAQKDGTLFLGNLEIKNTIIKPEVIELFENIYDENFTSSIITFGYKDISNSEFQLKKSEETIKTFKYGELYRFGIQFQSEDSKWTTPIWIGDKAVYIRPIIEDNVIKVPTALLSLHDSVKETISRYYVNYRLLIAEPTNADRRILAQGIVNPTVFNYEQRVKNTGPYAQASWIFRPRNGKAAFEHLEGLGNKVIKTEDDKLEFTNLPTCEIQNSLNKLPGVLLNGEESGVIINIYNKINFYQYDILKVTGTSLENFGNIESKLYSDYKVTSDIEEASIWLIDSITNDLSLNQEELGIDKNTLYSSLYAIQYHTNDTFGSIEGTSGWEFGWFSEKPGGKYDIMPNNISNGIPYGGCVTFKKIDDAIIDRTEEYKNNYYVDSSILTFHSPEIEDNIELFDGADLSVSIIGVVPISETISELNVETKNSGYSGISGVNSNYNEEKNKALINEAIFKDNSWNEKGVLNTNSLVSYYMYTWNKKGSIIGQTMNSKKDGANTGEDLEDLTSVYAELKSKTFANKYYSASNHYFTGPSFDIKPIVFSSKELESKLLHNFNKEVIYQGNCNTVAPTTTYRTLSKDLNYYKVFWKEYNNIDNYSEGLNQYDPVSIKYKTMPHLVFNIGNTVLPALYTKESLYWEKLNTEYGNIDTISYPWVKNSDIDLYSQLTLENPYNIDIKIDTPYFYLVEVNREGIDSSKIYGGTSENAIENIKWIPASNATPINQNITISYGDTYFQRYNCLHSYPYAPDDINSVIEVASFMVETHKNIESIYDKNKVIQRLLNINSETFNKDNPVYSQSNNYFTYNILDNKSTQTKYSNQIAFSLQKNSTSEIDTWCNITLASSFNLDGSKGKLNKIINFNDTLIAFQDRSISSINFNNRTALSTESGVPIEIANSGKVNGYSIIIDNIGCQNKQSICSASSGIYFIDDLNKTFYNFNKEGISNISSKGMSIWFKQNLTSKEKVFYDNLTQDIYITNKDNCLTYNEGLQSFISFMEYQNIDSIFNLNGNSFMLNETNNTINCNKMFAGDYTGDYSIEYKINPEPLIDKIFTNIEYIADCIPSDVKIDTIGKTLNLPFDKLNVWNEYQEGVTSLTSRHSHPNFERKFRIWRVDVPRDTKEGRGLNRIRNPWMYLKLSKDSNDKDKMVFHNLLVKYYK